MGRLSAQAVPLLKLLNIRAKIICNDHVSFKSFSRLIQIIKWPAYKMADKIVVLTENAVYSSQDIGYKEKIVLAVGRLTYQKNFQRLISLWKKINSSGWKLVIIGSGEDRAELEELISKNGLKNVFIENPSHKLDEWYKKSSLLVMTSRYEGLPMVLIESKNFGLPAVAFNCQTGPVEIIKDDCFVIDYDDDPEFIRKVDALLENEILRHELSNNSLKNAENFTGNTILKEWLSVLI
jgi:amylovoran biosynthesis glycosyltransferase AmsD